MQRTSPAWSPPPHGSPPRTEVPSTSRRASGRDKARLLVRHHVSVTPRPGQPGVPVDAPLRTRAETGRTHRRDRPRRQSSVTSVAGGDRVHTSELLEDAPAVISPARGGCALDEGAAGTADDERQQLSAPAHRAQRLSVTNANRVAAVCVRSESPLGHSKPPGRRLIGPARAVHCQRIANGSPSRSPRTGPRPAPLRLPEPPAGRGCRRRR
jgi:hypothetical protein